MEIQIQNLSKSFKINQKNKKKEKIKILDNLNLVVHNKEIYCLLGNNGAGKSTLLNCISGILTPDYGSIIYKTDRDEIDFIRNPKFGKKHLIFCFQDPKFDFNLNVLKNLKFHLNIHLVNRELRLKLIKEYLTLFDLWSKRENKIYILSGGQKKQLENIRGFLIADAYKARKGNNRTKEFLFITDEPTAYCDVHARTLIWEEIKKIADSNNTVILATNDLTEAQNLTNTQFGKIGFLKEGKITFNGNLNTLGNYLSDSQKILSIKLSDNFQKCPQKIFEDFESGVDKKFQKKFSISFQEPQQINIAQISEIDMNELMKYSILYFSSKNISVDKLERKKPELNELFV